MLVLINKTPKFIKTEPFELKFDEEVKEKIKENWDKFIEGKTDFWEGDIFSVSNYDIEDEILNISKAKFSELVYARQTNEITVRSLFVSILLKTKDNYYLVIRNNHNYINIIGGMADEADFVNEEFSPKECIKRELKEELNLDIDNLNQIENYEMKYLKLPDNNENEYPCGIVYVGTLAYSKDELLQYFYANKDKVDNEIQELYCYDFKECTNLPLNNKDIKYLKELLELENSLKN